MEKARIKINLSLGEIEFEGTEEFVKTQISNLSDLLEIVSQIQQNDIADTEVTELIEKNVQEQNKKIERIGEDGLEVTSSCGEWLTKFKDNLPENDYALVTAYYLQKQSSDNDFNSLEVTQVLKDHGHKLSNTSQSLIRLTSKKFVFQTRKEGKIKYMRVSADGIKHLKTLLREQ